MNHTMIVLKNSTCTIGAAISNYSILAQQRSNYSLSMIEIARFAEDGFRMGNKPLKWDEHELTSIFCSDCVDM